MMRISQVKSIIYLNIEGVSNFLLDFNKSNRYLLNPLYRVGSAWGDGVLLMAILRPPPVQKEGWSLEDHPSFYFRCVGSVSGTPYTKPRQITTI